MVDLNPNLTAIRAALAKDPGLVLNVMAGLIAGYGSMTEWDSDVHAGSTEALSALAEAAGLPSMGDQTRAALKFYKAAAELDADPECACMGGDGCDHEGQCEADPETDDWGWDGMCRSCCRNAEEAAEAAENGLNA